ncbi:uncharacterized protein BCR38DRAFT_447590 [Pseudomassariella vexata]|uniref:Uncharacterized protein n=1 Tax=Pseudomassariella vexata TaxID=1141098 RepID=A0A1Y2DH11_9PEZI|nr:uncharacterized protein BCR38DRAFT_447590 [Pseudomassariella vexata]ORY58538.1 hypothetical protein BCR38DRAFT_447590 [Pseudomassariella vexata]
MILPQLLLLLVLCWGLSTSANEPIATSPSQESARQNAFSIFNSIHSAMRQWGSSLHHNGISMIPATIPKGSLFYHGGPSSQTPPGPEWLAFDIEHSEAFAWSFPPLKDDQHLFEDRDEQKSIHSQHENVHLQPPSHPIRGYLHTYQATRDLNLLYVDGMSAGKSYMGTLDTQDLILRLLNNTDKGALRELERARELCDHVTEWGYDGLIRMEIGFEVIYCNFIYGLELIGMVRRPFMKVVHDDEIHSGSSLFIWARAVGQRYDGFTGGMVRLDFSRMVSAYFYPVNITNPDPNAQELPRLISSTFEERRQIYYRVREVSLRGKRSSIEWQTIVDAIITRYADRLDMMTLPSIYPSQFVHELFRVTDTYWDFPSEPDDVNMKNDDEIRRDHEARGRCSEHYLQPVEGLRAGFTPEDEVIYTAIKKVLRYICESLFTTRHDIQIALSQAPDEKALQAAIEKSQQTISKLMRYLDWSRWRKCRGCPVGMICFVAMWPYGKKIDHYKPGCRNETDLKFDPYDSYWGLGYS